MPASPRNLNHHPQHAGQADHINDWRNRVRPGSPVPRPATLHPAPPTLHQSQMDPIQNQGPSVTFGTTTILHGSSYPYDSVSPADTFNQMTAEILQDVKGKAKEEGDNETMRDLFGDMEDDDSLYGVRLEETSLA